ncbi:hypothetical protein ACF073_17195 [Streptomyces sp. NPDC015171]|uniref:hypothetical protein n=1 Tax=Streptomyces sp. NPDC015171 TaxID=3364945 RepID=UPI0036FC6511
MGDRSGSGRRGVGEYSAKKLVACVVGLLLVGTGAWFALTTGLDRLPSKVCDGAVERDLVIRTLPRTRTAEEGSERRREGVDLRFSCHVYTSADSILSGVARVDDASPQAWLSHYGGSPARRTVRVSSDGIEALAEVDGDGGSSSVYVPCDPRGVRAGDADRTYAVVAEAQVVGKARVSGTALGQALTDFAYRLTEHAYELAGCEKPRDFPDELPRYASG